MRKLWEVLRLYREAFDADLFSVPYNLVHELVEIAISARGKSRYWPRCSTALRIDGAAFGKILSLHHWPERHLSVESEKPRLGDGPDIGCVLQEWPAGDINASQPDRMR